MDLDLRDLQKSGRIGRIEVELGTKEGMTEGEIRIPSSLTRKETALLAATVETVTRVGPCEAEIKLKEIKDVRESKRKKIIKRAAELLKEWDEKSLETSEIEEKIEKDINLGEITEWGPDKLPAGPDVDKSDELIIVEGRADVLNLLRIGLKNTIAVQGTNIPKSVADLTRKKKNVIAFVDGDRGGTIILNELQQVAKLDYVARAPEGYEVEELTRKQMIKALQNKKPVKSLELEHRELKKGKSKDDILHKKLSKVKLKNEEEIINTIRNIQDGLAVGFNGSGEKLFELPVSELYEKIEDHSNLKVLIINGILSNRLLTVLIRMGISFIACRNKEEDLFVPNSISIYFF
ncbi:MAG: DNA primase DnaG [Promethearchaeota archaeon]